MTTATAKSKAAALSTAASTLSDYEPYIEACRNVDRCRAHKEAAEAALSAAQRAAREGAANRQSRVHALATGTPMPSILPDDHIVLRADEERATAQEAVIIAGQRRDQIRSEFKARCLAEVREARLDALRAQDEALAALEAAIREQRAIEASVHARGASTLSAGWYAVMDLRQLADARHVLSACARQLGGTI